MNRFEPYKSMKSMMIMSKCFITALEDHLTRV